MNATSPTIEALLAHMPALAPLLWPGTRGGPGARGRTWSGAEKLTVADREALQRIGRDRRTRRAGNIHGAYEIIREEERIRIRSRVMGGADVLVKGTWEHIRWAPAYSVPWHAPGRDPAAPQTGRTDGRLAGGRGRGRGRGRATGAVAAPQDLSELPGHPHDWERAVEMRFRPATSLTPGADAPAPVDAVRPSMSRPTFSIRSR
ncbi:hypothetical protein GCM10017778_68670 [Streptomyces vinaceus]|nr:hypothetical protein GCM10017778_68670 [Streptomyces vinaceus]